MSRKSLTKSDVVDLMKRDQGERSIRQYARDLGVSPAYLSDIYLGHRAPGPMILSRFSLVKRIKSETHYEKAV